MPFELCGLALRIASVTATRLSASCSAANEALPKGTCTMPFLSTRNSILPGVPQGGDQFLVLSTGMAVDASDPAYVSPNGGTTFTNTAPHPDPQADPADGCGQADPATVNDYVEFSRCWRGLVRPPGQPKRAIDLTARDQAPCHKPLTDSANGLQSPSGVRVGR